MPYTFRWNMAVAHLAGAIAKVWTLLPFAPDWRWLLGKRDTPCMRPFGRRPEDWKGVFGEVASGLREVSDSGILSGKPAIPGQQYR